jgi:ABC-type glycerol-3-phosphate transport system substrate-binding protein
LNALPAELDLAVVYYNKDLFDQAGVAYPARDWTIDDFLATAIALRKGLSEQDIAFGGQVDEAVPFVYAHGGLLKRGADFTLTHSHTSEALRWYADLALTHNVMALPARWETYQPEPGEGSISITETTVGEGETPAADRRWGSIAAMAQMAAQEGDVALWSAPLSERQGTGGWDWDFEWGVVPWPRDQVNIVLPYAFAYFIPAATPQPEAALRWIDFLTRQPPQLKGVPVRRSVAESEQVRQALGNAIGAEAYDACRASIEEATPVDYQLYSGAELILGQALLDVLEGGLEVETALSRAQDELGAQP